MVLAVVSLLGGEAALVGGFVEAGVAVAEVQTAADAGSDPSAIVIQSTSTVLRVFYEYFWSLPITNCTWQSQSGICGSFSKRQTRAAALYNFLRAGIDS